MNNKPWLFITLLLIAMTLIPLGDTAGKLLMQQGVTPTFVAWSRLFLGALLLLPLSRIRFSEISVLFDWRVLLRATFFICAVSCILKAVQTEDIATAFGAFFIGPIISYFVAAFLLKEKITLVRSSLLIIGFTGVLLVTKPGFGLTPGLAIAVLGGCFYGAMLVANRWLSDTFRPKLILLSTLILGSIVLFPFTINEIPTLNTELSLLIFLSSIASAIGNLLIIEASRKLSATTVAPFVYFQLVAATFFSVTVFNKLPDTLSLIGLAILVSSGFASYFIASRDKT